jgi:histidine triad (HIT) family protein
MSDMATNEDTIFDKIIRRELPAEIIYEDADTLAFLDINPDNPGHTLVVPKKPSRNIYDIDEASLAAIGLTAKKVAEALRDALGAEGVNIITNNERAAGQIIFYAHLHVVPRFTNDGKNYAQKGKPYAEGEAADIAQKIRAKLS